MKFNAIDYRGTSNIGVDTILKDGIDFNRRSDDVFLGRCFYLWRDSYERAKSWKGSESVVEVKIDISQDSIINLTSSKLQNEKKLLEIYFKYLKI